jgi:hypothetical protein
MLLASIDDFESDIARIRIGHPGTNIKELEAEGENALNLFFYHVSHDGYPADGTADNPFYVRLYCLITAIGHEVRKTNPDNTAGRDISKGENELRLIGEVMRVLHEQPVFSLADSNHEEMVTLQIVPHSITLDNLNHIWATQGSETPYRLSAAYEMSLAPVPYSRPARTSPVAGDPSMVVWGEMDRQAGKEKDGQINLRPVVAFLETGIEEDDWMPHLALVEKIGDPAAALHYVFKIEGSVAAKIDILVAGKEGEKVSFFWNVWRRKTDNSIVSWREDIADIETPFTVIDNGGSPDDFYPNSIDPAAIDARRVVQVKLPTDIGGVDTKTWQATLYAVRDWLHEEPSGNGEIITTKIRSNLLLLYGEGA